ncbi:MAG: DMT family transporter [Elusimicrobia bacterium]|nr:DMT family transporter [Elusimicrobiota bacterium]
MQILNTAALLYCTVVWGSSFFIVKDILSAVHPVTLTAYRFIIASVIFLPLLLWSKKNLRHSVKEGFFLAFWLTFLYVTQNWGLYYTTASNSGFITGLFVIFVPIIQFFIFSRPVSKLNWLASALAVAGLWILTGGTQGFNKGDALTILSSIAYAVQLLLVDVYLKRGADAMLMAFHQFWITALMCLGLSLAFSCPMEITSARAGYMLIFLAVFPTFSAFTIQVWAQKKASPIKNSLIFSLEPVFAAAFAWTLGGEQFKLSSLIGGTIIVLAIIFEDVVNYLRVKQI